MKAHLAIGQDPATIKVMKTFRPRGYFQSPSDYDAAYEPKLKKEGRKIARLLVAALPGTTLREMHRRIEVELSRIELAGASA